MLVLLAGVALQLYFLLRIALMTVLDPASTTFQRSEIWRLATTQGSVDCGIVYATDAYSAGLTVVDTATKDMCKQVVYPAAVLMASKNASAAKAFLSYLTTDEAMKVFEAVGFAPVA